MDSIIEMQKTLANLMANFEKEQTEYENEKKGIEENKRIRAELIDMHNGMVNLDVGGHMFITSKRTLQSVPDTFFQEMFKDENINYFK
jgi:hypothetical protein